MVLLGVVGLIEDEKVDIIDRYEGVHQALIEYLCCAHNDFVFRKVLCPSLFYPEVAAHFPTKAFNLLIQIALEYCKLLEDKGHAINLRDISNCKCKSMKGGITRKKEIRRFFPAARSSSSLSIMYFRSRTAIKVLPEPMTGSVGGWLSCHASY